MKKILFLLSILGFIIQSYAMEQQQVPMQISNSGHTPLIQAILNQKLDHVQVLLAQGVNPNELSPNKICGQWTPVEAATAVGNCAILRELINAHANLETRNFEGHTPLIRAAYADATELVQELLKGGADVHAKSQRSQKTALEYAYQNKNYLLTELLVAFDHDHSTFNRTIYKDVNNFLNETTEKNPSCYPISFLLEAANNSPNIFIRALQRNHLPLIAEGIRPGFHRIPALHYYLRVFYSTFNTEQRSSLYDHLNHENNTIPQIDIGSLYLNILTQIKKGFNIHKIDSSGYTPLHIAIANADETMVNILLSTGATLHGDSTINTLSEHICIPNECPLKHILKQLQDLKKRGNNTCYTTYLAILKSLLDHNEDLCQVTINFSPKIALRPIDFAVQNNLQEVVALLQQYMAQTPSLKKITSKKVISLLIQHNIENQKNYLSTLPQEMLIYLKQEANKEIATEDYKPFNYHYREQLKNIKLLIDQMIQNRF